MKLIAGVDEVGRGPLAGPVVAAAVVFKKGYKNPAIRDSKKLTAEERERLIDVIKADCIQWSIVAVGHHRIQALNIRSASRLAMELACRRIKADIVLVDGNMPIGTNMKQKLVIGGDDIHVEISAASILAKVWRDKLMVELDKRYPHYGFSKHAGYATKAHREAIRTHGPCRIHRRSFGGIREFFDAQQSLFNVAEIASG